MRALIVACRMSCCSDGESSGARETSFDGTTMFHSRAMTTTTVDSCCAVYPCLSCSCVWKTRRCPHPKSSSAATQVHAVGVDGRRHVRVAFVRHDAPELKREKGVYCCLVNDVHSSSVVIDSSLARASVCGGEISRCWPILLLAHSLPHGEDDRFAMNWTKRRMVLRRRRRRRCVLVVGSMICRTCLG